MLGFQTLMHLSVIILIFFFIVTLTMFVRFNNVNEILISKKRALLSNTYYFINAHHQSFYWITIINKSYGHILVFFLLANFPMNMFIFKTLFIDHLKLSNSMKIALSFMFTEQMFGFFAIHWICAMYSNKIHKSTKQLIHFNINHKYTSLYDLMKVSHYIYKFNTKKRYGINYQKYGLVTMNAFFKVINF